MRGCGGSKVRRVRGSKVRGASLVRVSARAGGIRIAGRSAWRNQMAEPRKEQDMDDEQFETEEIVGRDLNEDTDPDSAASENDRDDDEYATE